MNINKKALKSAVTRLAVPWGVTALIVFLYYWFVVGKFDNKSFLATLTSTSIAVAGLFAAYYREEKRHDDKSKQNRNYHEIQKVGELIEFLKDGMGASGSKREKGMAPLPTSGKVEKGN